MMSRPALSRRIAALVGIAAVAAAAAVGGYFASQIGDGTGVAEEVGQSPTPTPLALRWPNPFPTAEEVEIGPDGKYIIRRRADGCDYREDQRTVRPEDGRLWILLRSPECALVGLLIPGRQNALEVVPIPTVPTPATREPSPTPTPQPGVCPPPVRQTPGDFPEPPPAIEPPGRHVEGGTSFAEGYVTVHLPAGRQFIIQTGWSTDADGVYIAIYDVQAQSSMTIRGDGCETWRLVRDPTADLVFDEIMATLDVGGSYACPSAGRVTPEDFPGTEKAPALSQIGGEWVKGGAALKVGDLTLQMPAGREFRVGGGVSSPGGSFLWLYDIESQSYLYVRPDGCESGRFIRDPAADAVFDEIVAALEVER
jgi:hypothetical protein